MFFVFFFFTSNHDLLSQQNKEIIFDAAKGIYFDGNARVTPTGRPVSSTKRFKLCACLNTGKLFRVAVNSSFSTCTTVEKFC